MTGGVVGAVLRSRETDTRVMDQGQTPRVTSTAGNPSSKKAKAMRDAVPRPPATAGPGSTHTSDFWPPRLGERKFLGV